MALVVRNLKIGTGMPKICVPITGQSIEEIKAEAVKIAADESKQIWLNGVPIGLKMYLIKKLYGLY